jgi:hypothetical protein
MVPAFPVEVAPPPKTALSPLAQMVFVVPVETVDQLLVVVFHVPEPLLKPEPVLLSQNLVLLAA